MENNMDHTISLIVIFSAVFLSLGIFLGMIVAEQMEKHKKQGMTVTQTFNASAAASYSKYDVMQTLHAFERPTNSLKPLAQMMPFDQDEPTPRELLVYETLAEQYDKEKNR